MTPEEIILIVVGEAGRQGKAAPGAASDQARKHAALLAAALGLTHEAEPPRAIEAPPAPQAAQRAAVATTQILPLPAYRPGAAGVPPDPRLGHDMATSGGRRRYEGWAG